MSTLNDIDDKNIHGMEENKSNSTSTRRFSINLRTLHCKAVSFLIYSITGTLYAFQNVFLVSLGISVGNAGFITGTCYVAATITGPCMGALADKTGYRKTIFMALSLGVLFTFFPMPWVARELQESLYSGHATNHSQPAFLDLNLTDSKASNINHLTRFKPIAPSQLFSYVIGAILIVGHSCAMTIMSFADSAIMNVLETIETKEGFGQQRMFGSLGVGVTAFLAGFAVDQYEHATLSKYTAVYFVLLPYILIGAPLTMLLFKYGNWELQGKKDDGIRKISNDSREKNTLIFKSERITEENMEINDFGLNSTNEIELFVSKSNSEETETADSNTLPRSRARILKDIFKNADNVFMMTTNLLFGAVGNFYFGFLFLTIKDEMGGSKSAMGLCMLVNAISSATMFYFTKRVINFLGGPFVSVALSMIFWFIRLLVISYIKNAWLVVLPQLLQSVCFSLFWAAMVQHIHNVSTKEVYITLYTILTSLNFGVGGALGHMAGGTLYKAYGGPRSLRGVAVFSCSWFILTVVYHCLYRKTLKNRNDRNKASENT